MPKFSIIVATYNQLELLKECLVAIDKQSFKDFDVHVCDDGSTDGTREYMESRAGDKGLFYHRQENRGNFGANINQALFEAKGKYFVFIASDSMPETDYLEVLNAYAEPYRVICGIRLQIAEVEGKMQGVDIDWRLKKNTIPDFAAPVVGQPWNALTGNGLTVPAEAFELYGPFVDLGRGYGGEDTELIARLFFKGYICWSVPELKLYHHWHRSRDASAEVLRETNKLLRSYAS